MGKTGEIAQFNSSDGLTPWQVRKLNSNFENIQKRIPSDSVVEVKSVETLEPGQPAYVDDVGVPPVALLKFGIPKGEKGDKGDQGDKGDPGDPTDLIHVGPDAPDPRTTEVLWYDTDDGKLSAWQLDSSATPPEWKWKAL